MKRILILVAAVLAVGFSGCREESGPSPSGGQTPNQSHENPQPKTKMPDPDL